MPTVPIPTGPSVAPSSGRLGIQAPEGAFGLNTIAQGLSELGHSAQTISDTFAQHAEQIQTINNKAAADDAFVKHLQAVNQYAADYKSNNLGMKAYENLPQAFKDLDQQRDTISATLTNPNARAMFDADSRRATANITGELSRFASSQRKESVVKSSAAVQEALVSNSVLHPENFTANMSKFMEQQAFLNTQLGLTDAEGDLAARKAYGGAVGAVTKTLAANGDITGAAKFLEDHKEGMDGLVYAQTLAQLRPALQANDAAHLGDLAVQSALGEGADNVPLPQLPSTPGKIADGNLDPWHRKVLQNPDGSYSTTSSISIGTDKGEVLIPTVVDGKRLTQKEAIQHYKDTGENLGTFDTPEHADAYAQELHNRQEAYVDAVRKASLGSGTRAERNNNPGNIEDGAFAKSQPGYIGSDGRFAKFDSAASGGAAQSALLKSYIRGGQNTIAKIVAKWAPPGENDTEAYISKVESITGIGRNVALDPNGGKQLDNIREAMAQVEGFGRSRGKQSVDSSAGGPMTSFDLQGRANDVLAAADQYAEQHAPGNAAFKDQVEQRAMSGLNRMIAAARDTEVQAYTNLGSAIEQGNIQDQATLFKTVPGAAEQWNKLPLTQRNALMSDMNRQSQIALTDPEVQAKIAALTGMQAQAANGTSQEFLNADIAGMGDIPPKVRQKFMDAQAKLRAKQYVATSVDKATHQAMGSIVVKAALQSLDIDPRNDKDKLNIFQGTLSSAIQDFADQHGGQLPQMKDLNGIVATMVAHAGGKFAGVDARSMGAAFGIVPPAEAQAIAAEFRAKGVTPSPEDIQAIYSKRHSSGR